MLFWRMNSIWEAYAKLLVDYSVCVQAGEYVMVQTTPLAGELALEIYKLILERGAFAIMNIGLPGMQEIYFNSAQDVHFDGSNEYEQFVNKRANAVINIGAPENTRALSGVDPTRQRRNAIARQDLQSHMLNNVKWLACQFPTNALAQEAGMSLSQHTAFVVNALGLEHHDPTALWRERGVVQTQLVNRLTKADRLEIRSAQTNLTMRVKNRIWINDDGQRNMPGGEVFSAPIEDSVNGHVYFDIPAIAQGREVRGVRLEFKDGLVVNASAEIGEAYLHKMLETDAGAKRLGEVGIGTNYGITRATGSILFDEKMGGTIHLALGRAYTQSGGVNQSAIHWDLITDLRNGGQLIADGEVIQDNGKFKGVNLEF
jgi:aminopeptidase